MADAPAWFLKIVASLSGDYDLYNALITQLTQVADNPFKARLEHFLVEERRRGRKIIKAETILARWLKDAPELSSQAAAELALLEQKRDECRKVRREGSRVLESGLSLLEKESRKVRNPSLRKSRTKETAPRLIDIKL